MNSTLYHITNYFYLPQDIIDQLDCYYMLKWDTSYLLTQLHYIKNEGYKLIHRSIEYDVVPYNISVRKVLNSYSGAIYLSFRRYYLTDTGNYENIVLLSTNK